jgi:cation diffusion facilitator CzcD-associated flavoprotein CzcO
MSNTSFKTFDAPALAARKFRVIQVGTGMVGCHFASRFREFTTGIEYQVYDKCAEVGGTWIVAVYRASLGTRRASAHHNACSWRKGCLSSAAAC